MPVIAFTPDRQPRRAGAPIDAAMTIWQVLLNLIAWLNQNFVGQFASGIATITSGNTTVAVTHNLATASYRISLTPNGSNPGGFWWVTAKTGTSFTINVSVAAPVGGTAFDWTARKE